MPTYLCHGFRWHRRSIRFFVIIYDVLDAAPDWIVGRGSSAAILAHFYERYEFLPRPPSFRGLSERPIPRSGGLTDGDEGEGDDDNRTARLDQDPVLINDEWSAVKLLEEYDPRETVEPCRPHAYVADYAVRVELSADVTEEIARYERIASERGDGSWFEKLRDALEEDEEIGWFVVVNGIEDDIVEAGRGTSMTEQMPGQSQVNESDEKIEQGENATNHNSIDDLGKQQDMKRPSSRMKRLKEIVLRK
ncbi:unnamed protein product [Clonostachys rosea f. rosea IK726]|jgi:hypothetical protein|uniref:Uncharacterized protein n=2 Tax=Bionectria ochroleuca TaxID=29856 RepID=A0A0B7JT88_BIOOC|nr:unnamed protein product [Clonostachys rosea f. rosea IK726]